MHQRKWQDNRQHRRLREKYNKLIKRYEKTSKALYDTKEKIANTTAHRKKVDTYLKNIKKQNELVAEFSETMMATLMDYTTDVSQNNDTSISPAVNRGAV